MTDQERSQYIEYALSLPLPAEADFFSPEQKAQIAKQQQAYENTQKFVASVLNKEDVEDLIQKATIEGRIIPQSQFANMSLLFAALEGDGTRVDVNETLVSPSGQRVIMSGRLQDILGFVGDGYMLKDELDELVRGLQADSVPGPQIDKVTAVMNKNGAIVLQRGIFAPLKSMLEEAVGKSLSLYTPKTGTFGAKPTPQFAQKPADQLSDLPFSFIEYLKNNDKEYDRVEHEIMKDEKFVEFFANLKKHYNYYQNMSDERMAGEVIIREQLWSKLQPQTKAWVQTIVQRNHDNFVQKISEISNLSHADKLEELKRSLGK